MPAYRRVPVAVAMFCCAALAKPAPAHAIMRDYGAITCGAFLASGVKNMGYLLWWLRGYHAGRRGVPVFDPQDAYATRLGYYCRNHPRAKLIDDSEHILSQLDRGI
jgi:HdeA/HdeB family